MRSMLGIVAIAGALLINGIAAFSPPQTFENTQFVRVVDLSSSYVKESVAIKVRNVGQEPVNKCYYALKSTSFKDVAVVEGREKRDRVAAVTLEHSNNSDPVQYVFHL